MGIAITRSQAALDGLCVAERRGMPHTAVEVFGPDGGHWRVTDRSIPRRTTGWNYGLPDHLIFERVKNEAIDAG
jgi:hypothetical protein